MRAQGLPVEGGSLRYVEVSVSDIPFWFRVVARDEAGEGGPYRSLQRQAQLVHAGLLFSSARWELCVLERSFEQESRE